jgi:hypothetical protein
MTHTLTSNATFPDISVPTLNGGQATLGQRVAIGSCCSYIVASIARFVNRI